MKVLLFVCLILFSSQGRTKSLHTFSFNLHCTFNDWKTRVDIIARHLAKSRPDFIAFQEVCRDKENEMLDFIVERLNYYGYIVASQENQFSHMAWDRYEEHLMVVSKHRAEAVDKGFLPTSPLQRSYLALKINGVWLVNTHLEYKDEWSNYRAEQFDYLIQRFKNTPHMMMGDFNSEPGAPEHAMLFKAKYGAYFPGPTYPSNNPKYFIDGFWLSPLLKISISSIAAQTVFRDRSSLSDHLAVELKVISK